eukprot:TRINITY_DN18830_c0_g1_i1.p1 TRINITY_DN18830_c0_g1~~TRINITY_DN18830_c0_g1_i1.p1  ORF type:complete len:391 (+),score=33.02 TRINITY_DN18830_c0_g1_i1:37-1209(+)
MVVISALAPWLLTALFLVGTHVLPTWFASIIVAAPSGRKLVSVDAECSFTDASSEPTTTKDATWQKLRLEGWTSNVMVTMLVIAMFASYRSLREMLVPFDSTLLWRIPLIYVVDSMRSLLSVFLAYNFNLHVYNMSRTDFWLIRKRRDTWTEGVEATVLVDRYGLVPAKIMDAVNRRVGHLVHYGIHLSIFMFGCKSSRELLQTYVYLTPFRCLVHVVQENNDFFGVVDYSGARIRDGRYGRFNLLVVAFWGGFGKVFMLMCLILSGIGDQDYNTFSLYGALAMQGVIWGDTAGEVVGSFFGRLEFSVRGFGETNKKTVEGTLAVWFATALSSWCVTTLPQFENVRFQTGKLLLILVLSTVATIMEIGSPRGTDNFFILAGGILSAFLCS